MTSNMMISIYHIDIFHIHKRAHRRIECVWINLPMTYMETRLNFRLRYKMHYSYLMSCYVMLCYVMLCYVMLDQRKRYELNETNAVIVCTTAIVIKR